MYIEDLMNLFIDKDSQHIIIYGYESEDNIFTGYYAQCPQEYRSLLIEKIDNLTGDTIVFNVDH